MCGDGKGKGLLEYLSQEVGCIYISDLCQPVYIKRIKMAVDKINPDHYGLNQWHDAVAYIAKQTVEFDNGQQYKKYLLDL